MSNNCQVCGKGSVVKHDATISFEHNGKIIIVDQTDEYCDVCGTTQKSIATIDRNLKRVTSAIESVV